MNAKKLIGTDLSKLAIVLEKNGVDTTTPTRPKVSPPVDYKALTAKLREIVHEVTEAVIWLFEKTIGAPPETDAFAASVRALVVASDVAKQHKYLSDMLSVPNPVNKAFAAAAYICACADVSSKCERSDQVRAIVNDLIVRGLFRLEASGPIKIGNGCFQVGSGFAFEDLQKTDIMAASVTLSNKLAELGGTPPTTAEAPKKTATKTITLVAEETTTLEQVRNGENDGIVRLYIPQNGMCHVNDTPFHAPGEGHLMVSFRGNDVSLVDASGPIEEATRTMRSMGVILDRGTLGFPRPPGCGDAYARVCVAIRNEHNLTKEEAETYVGCLQDLWLYIRIAIRHHDRQGQRNLKEEAHATARKATAEKATASAAKFYGLDGSPEGTMFLELNKTFMVEGGKDISHPFMLVESVVVDAEQVFTIKEVSLEATEVFGKFIGKDYKVTPGFTECPKILIELLVLIGGQVKSAQPKRPDAPAQVAELKKQRVVKKRAPKATTTANSQESVAA